MVKNNRKIAIIERHIKMKKTQKKKIVPVIMHQHQDQFGRVCGSLHPLNAEHKKESTQKLHDITVNKQ